jgi:phospholipid/cholesterol/gamma-HCH transport system substrate-binding protein
MRTSRATELSTGFFVLLGFAALFFLVTQITNRGASWSGGDGFRVTAKFDNIGQLKVRAAVSMSGVTVGRVEGIEYDKTDYKALVTMRIDKRYDSIPNDSDASIYTSGLLGGQYIGISPGGSETNLKDGDQIEFTQSAIVLENLISKFLFSMAGKDKKQDSEDQASAEDKSK